MIYIEQENDIRIIEATGTWGNPNPKNSTGGWLQSEKALADYIEYGFPDINTNTKRFANKKIGYWWWPFGY